MTPVVLVALCGALTTIVLVVLLLRARAATRARTQRRVAALGSLAETIERLATELEAVAAAPRPTAVPDAHRIEPRPAPVDPATGLPARAALVDVLVERVADAQQAGGRLGLAFLAVRDLDAGVDDAVSRLAEAARETAPGTPTFRAGERAVALVLPDGGRADAIAAVAKIEAALGSGAAVSASVGELEEGEDALALLARVSLSLTAGRNTG